MASRTYYTRAASVLLFLLGISLQAFSGVNSTPTIDTNRAAVNEGEEIVINCHVPEPVKTGQQEHLSIMKRQSPDHEAGTITFDSVIIHDSYKGRVTIQPISGPNGFALGYKMAISEATPHDSGEYGCRFIQGEKEETVWTEVAVRQQLQKLELFAVAENGTEILLEDGKSYQLTSEEQYHLKCLASGSNPAATMSVSLGEQDITSQLFERTVQLQTDSTGMGVRSYDTTLTSKDVFEVLVPQSIRCRAHVEGSEGTKSVTIMTIFQHPPHIECFETVAGEKNADVELACNVTSNPKVNNIHWIMKYESGLNETVTSTTKGEGFYISTEHHKNNVSTTKFHIDQVFAQHFKRTYIVVASNEKGTTKKDAILTEDPNMGKTTSTASVLGASLLLITFTAIFRKL